MPLKSDKFYQIQSDIPALEVYSYLRCTRGVDRLSGIATLSPGFIHTFCLELSALKSFFVCFFKPELES